MRLRRGESGEGPSAGQSLDHAMKNLETEGSAGGRLAKVRHGESGQTTVVMTLFLATFLFGFIAVGIDVEALFAARRQAQAAADAAAIAAAEESGNTTNEQTAAWGVAALNGFDHLAPVNPAIVNVLQRPSTGNYASAPAGAYLEVQVSKPVRLFFASIVTHKTTVVVAARAVAAPAQTSPTCVCLEGTTGTDLNLSNNSVFNPTGCGTTVDSDGSTATAVTVADSAKLGGTSIGTKAALSTWQGSVPTGDLLATHVVGGLTSVCSPVPPAAPAYNPALCTNDPYSHYGNGGSTYNIGPNSDPSHPTWTNTQTGGVVCYNSLSIGFNSDMVTILPGIYVINGGTVEFKSGNGTSSNAGGTGVVFYLTGSAKLVIGNGAGVNLTAPTTGTYANILVYQDPGDSTLTVPRAADSQPMTIGGGSTTSFNGAIFAPTSALTLDNGSSTSIGADIVANTLTMGGGGTLNSTPKTNLGTYNTSTAKLTE